MCTFDSPVSRCEARQVMVLTDQTQAACARENGCPPRFHCPLAGYFTGVELFVLAPKTKAPSHRPLRLAA